MLLALDVGNTNITVGIFKNGVLADHRRLRTVREQTSDEWGILLSNLLRFASLDPKALDGIVISSVVPPLDTALAEMAQRYFDTAAMFVTAETDTGLTILYENPAEVGADRIVNSVAALHKYGGFASHAGLAKHYWMLFVIGGALIIALVGWAIRRRRGGGVIEPAAAPIRKKP